MTLSSLFLDAKTVVDQAQWVLEIIFTCSLKKKQLFSPFLAGVTELELTASLRFCFY